MEEQRNDNLNFGGAIAQKLETVKSEETVWNEYFTSILYYNLNNHPPVITSEGRQKITKMSAEWADLMIDEYLDRYGIDE